MTMTSHGRRRPEIGVVTQYLRELRRESRAARRLDVARPSAAQTSPPRAVPSGGRKTARTA